MLSFSVVSIFHPYLAPLQLIQPLLGKIKKNQISYMVRRASKGSSESEGEKYDFNFAESSLESFHISSVEGKKWEIAW